MMRLVNLRALGGDAGVSGGVWNSSRTELKAEKESYNVRQQQDDRLTKQVGLTLCLDALMDRCDSAR